MDGTAVSLHTLTLGHKKEPLAPARVPRYKGKEDGNGRSTILTQLKNQMTLPAKPSLMRQNDDALDAALCVLAGADFLRGWAEPSKNLAQAQKEGWIWVRH